MRPLDEERPPWEDDEPGYGSWEWEATVNRSLPSTPLSDVTASGKFSVVLPLTPGMSLWGRGVSAPKAPRAGQGPPNPRYPGPPAAPPGVEVDAQPSARMRALQPGNVMRATAIITVFILVSKVLGLVRTSLFAGVFGVNAFSDAYVRAFILPDAIFNIVAGGALASAFIPVFTDYLIAKRDRNTAWHVASATFNAMTLLLTVVAVLCIIFAEPILRITIPTIWTAKPGQIAEGPEVVTLTRVMLLQPIFLGVSTLGVAILQARQRFLLPAIGQAIYTLGPIGGILATLLDRHTGIFGHQLGLMGPTWGVVAGAVLQFSVQVPGLVAAKMRYRLTFDFLHPGVLETFRLMLPRIVNASMNYVAIFISQTLLGLLNSGATYGYLTAFTLAQLPLSLFSIAVAQAAFPTMTAFVADNQWDRLRATIQSTLRGVMYLAIPASLGLGVLARPIVNLLLAHGRFTDADINAVAIPLIFFAVGLLGLALNEILTRTFYALHNSRTPVQVNLLFLPIVIGLSVILLNPMGAAGLSLAFSVGALGESVVLLLLLSRRVGRLNLSVLGIFGINVLAASLVMALVAVVTYMAATVLLPTARSATVETVYLAIRLGIAMGIAGITYYVMSRFLHIDDTLPLDRLLGRFLPGRRR
jgi:putative peptidoglycan lipid II flippase